MLAIKNVVLACRPTKARLCSERPTTRRRRTALRLPVELEEDEKCATSASAGSEERAAPLLRGGQGEKVERTKEIGKLLGGNARRVPQT